MKMFIDRQDLTVIIVREMAQQVKRGIEQVSSVVSIKSYGFAQLIVVDDATVNIYMKCMLKQYLMTNKG